jgi:hypothetical protein
MQHHESISKVPWEPYKAAVSGNSSSISKFLCEKSDNQVASITPLPTNINRQSLVRYKVETNLDLFNSKRPGSQFNESDLLGVNNFKSNVNTKSVPEFIDARFYTDFHFLKLANELKKKSLDKSAVASVNQQSSKTNDGLTKPVNIVGPLKKNDATNNGDVSILMPSPSSASPQHTTQLTKAQMSQYEERIAFLESQIEGLNEQLHIQTQVNAELKKLLVAAIGDDMQYKVERLVNDKQRYEYEIDNYSKEIERLNEQIEQMGIQCDLVYDCLTY